MAGGDCAWRGKFLRTALRSSGGRRLGKVSWQVTGIRHDAYANAPRIPVSEDKPAAEQGCYLHPDVYGQSEGRPPVAVR